MRETQCFAEIGETQSFWYAKNVLAFKDILPGESVQSRNELQIMQKKLDYTVEQVDRLEKIIDTFLDKNTIIR